MKKLTDRRFWIGLNDSDRLPSYQEIYEQLKIYEHRMKVYVIEVVWLSDLTSKVSSEGYYELSDAQLFCENRGDKPKKISDFKYESQENLYNILELSIC